MRSDRSATGRGDGDQEGLGAFGCDRELGGEVGGEPCGEPGQVEAVNHRVGRGVVGLGQEGCGPAGNEDRLGLELEHGDDVHFDARHHEVNRGLVVGR